MKTRLLPAGLIGKTEVGRRMVADQYYRMSLLAVIAFIADLLYAFYNGVLGIVNVSLWYLALCALYGILALMRFAAILCRRKIAPASVDDTEPFVLKILGVMLIILSLVLAGVIYINLSQSMATQYDEIIMISIAAYTFYKITLTIIKAAKQRHNPSLLSIVLRHISYAEVAIAVLALQWSMLVSFGAMTVEKICRMNLMTGVAVCLFVMILGISIIIKTRKENE